MQMLERFSVLSYAGEYQPIYDEFGAVFVLVMAFVNRYHLTHHDIGIGVDTFIAHMITKGHQSISLDNLTKEQDKYLGYWVKGLLNSGNEGLSNDVFASCRPQEFYLIVPTLFQQIVMGLSQDVLSFDTIKGALECKCSQDASALRIG
jgi:mediator of RNA polymerase II transcription subunit 5